MKDLCLHFQVHQPYRLKNYTFFDIGKDPFYENDELNRDILDRVSDRCYLPANRLFTQLIDESPGKIKLALSLSGVLLEQLENHRPDVLASFQNLVATGNVELLCETYYHSLCYRASGKEFARQIGKQMAIIKHLFNQTPTVFRHTELIYFNKLAAFVEDLGFQGQLAEGVDHFLAGRTPNRLYQAPNGKKIKTILRNNSLSDDVAFRIADPNWEDYPLTPKKFAKWIRSSEGDFAGIFLDYETIGEHLPRSAGIFDFWRDLPAALAAEKITMATPSEILESHKIAGIYDRPEPIDGDDNAKDFSAWKSNPMQEEAVSKILAMEDAVKVHDDPALLHQWSKMQTSDHFHYMATKDSAKGEIHEHFSPYPSPHDAYLNFMNVLSDLQIRVGL